MDYLSDDVRLQVRDALLKLGYITKEQAACLLSSDREDPFEVTSDGRVYLRGVEATTWLCTVDELLELAERR